MRKIWAGILGLVAVLAIGASPVAANKANDTLTVAVHDWWSTLDPYQFPLDEANVFYTVVYETLIGYDERAHQFVPRLAKSWRQIDDKTVEFDLRDDVKFHNGDKFDADDVVGTIKYLIDPAVPLRFKSVYDWVDKVEKTGPYQVRITAKKAQARRAPEFRLSLLYLRYEGPGEAREQSRLRPHGRDRDGSLQGRLARSAEDGAGAQ